MSDPLDDAPVGALPPTEDWLAEYGAMDEVCPKCGHSDKNHDEFGCDLCECTGP